MKYITGEYIFNNIEHIKINKLLIDRLYVSALYFRKNKCILEVLAPRSLATKYDEHEEDWEKNITIGDRWAKNMKASIAEEWPLANANYYIEVNGVKIGEDYGSTTSYRYEPQNIKENESHKNIKRANQNLCEGLNEYEVIKPTKNGLQLPVNSPSEALKSIFEDEDFSDTVISMISSMPAINLENTDEEEEYRYLEYYEKKNKKEREFFDKFRSCVTIPDYLNDESIMIADLIFKSKDTVSLNEKMTDLKFVLKSYKRYYLTRINLKLPFGKYEDSVPVYSKEWDMFTNKIAIEGVIERKKDSDGKNNIPDGKKAVFIIYETIDNVLVQPIFYTTEILTSYDLPNRIFDKIELLKDKGKNGFNKYITFAGYVDENADIGDIELFKLIVTYECNKKILL